MQYTIQVVLPLDSVSFRLLQSPLIANENHLCGVLPTRLFHPFQMIGIGFFIADWLGFASPPGKFKPCFRRSACIFGSGMVFLVRKSHKDRAAQ